MVPSFPKTQAFLHQAWFSGSESEQTAAIDAVGLDDGLFSLFSASTPSGPVKVSN